jgi:hypothetical protein
VLALMRLWDNPQHTLRLEQIARTLSDPKVIDALAFDRAPFPEAKDGMKQDLARLISGGRHHLGEPPHSQQVDCRLARGSRPSHRRDTRADRGHFQANRSDRSFGGSAQCQRSRSISRHARSGNDARPRRGGWGQKSLSEPFGAESWLLDRRLCRSPLHHQRRVRGIARRLRQAGRPFDGRVSLPRRRDR